MTSGLVQFMYMRQAVLQQSFNSFKFFREQIPHCTKLCFDFFLKWCIKRVHGRGNL